MAVQRVLHHIERMLIYVRPDVPTLDQVRSQQSEFKLSTLKCSGSVIGSQHFQYHYNKIRNDSLK